MSQDYDADYFDEASTKPDSDYPVYFDWLKRSDVKLTGATVVDIGCATGGFLAGLVDHNDCFGVDISEYAINRCRKRFPKIQNHFTQLDLNQQAYDPAVDFDLVALFDVIEHLDNFSFLKQFLSKHLKRGGNVIVTTPNVNSPLRFRPTSFTGEIDPTHRFLFTSYSLDFWLRRCGLEKRLLLAPFSFYFKNNRLSRLLPWGGQIVAIYQRPK